MFSGQARTHAPQVAPLEVSRHLPVSTVGTNVLFALPTSDMRAPSGQSAWHHLRKNTTSARRISGATSTIQLASPVRNRFATKNSVANVRPTGHTRQNTGNPKISVESSAEPRTKWRASRRLPRLLAHAVQPPASRLFSSPVSSARFAFPEAPASSARAAAS